jgi:hypothetical protein
MSADRSPKKRKKRLTGIALVVGGLLLWMFGCAGVTPASVSVSGYYRSDGTYVDSYNRRPPGSVAHDSPFETAEWLGFFFVCSGVYVLVTKESAHDGSTIYYRDSRSRAAQTSDEIELVPVPTNRGIAEADWRCEGCNRPFGHGTPYWFNDASLPSSIETSWYCPPCRDKLVLANRNAVNSKSS